MTCPEVEGVGSGEGGSWRWTMSPEECQWSGCGKGRRGGAVHGAERNGEGGR